MKITKYGHACLLLEKNGTRLLIDPGSFTELPNNLPKIDFVIVSEEHYDHLNVDNLKQVENINQDVQIYTTTSAYQTIMDADMNANLVSGDKTLELHPFSVNFSETDHAVVYQKSPCKSLAITVDDFLYYPSDTYRTISKEVQVLALPTSGPWFRVAECIDFVNATKSKIIIATHNGLNSENGNKVTHNFIVNNLDPNRQFIYLKDGESLKS